MIVLHSLAGAVIAGFGDFNTNGTDLLGICICAWDSSHSETIVLWLQCYYLHSTEKKISEVDPWCCHHTFCCTVSRDIKLCASALGTQCVHGDWEKWGGSEKKRGKKKTHNRMLLMTVCPVSCISPHKHFNTYRNKFCSQNTNKWKNVQKEESHVQRSSWHPQHFRPELHHPQCRSKQCQVPTPALRVQRCVNVHPASPRCSWLWAQRWVPPGALLPTAPHISRGEQEAAQHQLYRYHAGERAGKAQSQTGQTVPRDWPPPPHADSHTELQSLLPAAVLPPVTWQMGQGQQLASSAYASALPKAQLVFSALS